MKKRLKERGGMNPSTQSQKKQLCTGEIPKTQRDFIFGCKSWSNISVRQQVICMLYKEIYKLKISQTQQIRCDNTAKILQGIKFSK